MDRITVNGKNFIDEHGRQRIFNGMNYADKSGLKYCFINSNEYTELNIRKLSECGFNVIRLGVTWEAIETDGEYQIIPLGETGRSRIEIKTDIGSHKIKVNFK